MEFFQKYSNEYSNSSNIYSKKMETEESLKWQEVLLYNVDMGTTTMIRPFQVLM